jgi:hypothetical protein
VFAAGPATDPERSASGLRADMRFCCGAPVAFQGTDVSDEVLVELQRELPHCRIEVVEAP